MTCYADDNYLVLADGSRHGPFSSHWAACAAMIRRTQPGFVSMGGDRLDDLEREAAIPPDPVDPQSSVLAERNRP